MKPISLKPCVIVASMGRSGSTLCFSTLNRSARTWLVRNPARFEPSLSRASLRRGTIIKTHDYPDGLRTRDTIAKVLFIFGSTCEAALSVYTCKDRFGADWVAEHFRNCKSPFAFDDLLEFDALGMTQQIKAWSVFDQVPVLCVRFDALWAYSDDIARFTGYPFDLPPRQTRASQSVPEDVRQRARAVYAPLDEKIARLPDLFMAGPEMAPRLDGIPDIPAFDMTARA
jgi:hypothetical protein